MGGIEHEDDLIRLAMEHHGSGRLAEARALYKEILQAAPDHTEAWRLLGVVCYQTGQLPQAEDAFRRAIALDASPRDYNSLAILLREQGRFDEAIAAYRQALERDSDNPDLHCDLGDVLQSRGRLPEAIAAYQRSLQLNPGLARAWYAAGCAESSRKQFAAAMVCFGRALQIRPDWPEAQHNLGQALFKLGQVEAALELFRRSAASGDPALPLAAIAVMIPGCSSSDNQAILDARRAWAERQLPGIRVARPAKTRKGPLRIGYVSAFFPDHNWMKPVWGLINRHDRRRFEVHLFSDAPASRVLYGYRSHPQDRFHDTTGFSNEALRQLIEQQEIDVIVDLNGYSVVRRLPLFTMRPAPVVAGWFNIYATTGISGYDYLIGDETVIPPEEDRFYCEKIVRVPGSYLTFEVNYPVPDVADPPCLAGGRITFGCLASQYKITDDVIGAWSEILRQLPDSSLVLRNGALTADTQEFVHRLFDQHDIARERIRMYGSADHYRFLETYGEIDIALDTFPYNGGTTTTEAIWQGVPVVTYWGDRWVARTSASILRGAGLGEFVGRGLDDYISIAVRMANAPDRLVELRRNMRSRLRDSAVCDTEGFARNMETIYEQMLAGALA